jgi:rhamnosyl/mannosyltransferase
MRAICDDMLRAAAVFVLPSHLRSEAFGLCQIEAMACGLPIVSTDLPTGVPEVNRHGESGLIVPPADPGALAAAIQALLENPELRLKMGEAGRRRADEHYTAERMTAAVVDVYRDALRMRPL